MKHSKSAPSKNLSVLQAIGLLFTWVLTSMFSMLRKDGDA